MLAVFALLSCLSFSPSLFAATRITGIPVLIDNPTAYDVELWLSDGESKQNEKEPSLIVHSGQSINYAVPLKNPILSETTDTIRKLSYCTQLNDVADDDESEAGAHGQESSFSVDVRDGLVHLVLQVERIFPDPSPEDEQSIFDPFDVISINKK